MRTSTEGEREGGGRDKEMEGLRLGDVREEGVLRPNPHIFYARTNSSLDSPLGVFQNA
jgi:hypothetical protein